MEVWRVVGGLLWWWWLSVQGSLVAWLVFSWGRWSLGWVWWFLGWSVHGVFGRLVGVFGVVGGRCHLRPFGWSNHGVMVGRIWEGVGEGRLSWFLGIENR